ncbi:MAG: nucleotidyltransferase family protein, partial [Clostridia bacterium]
QPITRIGCGYNSENLTGEISSATAIRLAIKQGNRDVLNAMPSFVGGALFYDDNFVISQSSLSDMMLYAIRTLRPEDLMEIPEVNEGFENVLYKAARSVNHIEVFYDTVKSKRYTLARVKRIAVCALLGITADQIHATIHSQEGSYLRVLGFKKDARSLLSMIGKYKRIPMILRNSDIENCPLIVQRNLETDMLSTDLIAYATQREIRRDLSGAIMLE